MDRQRIRRALAGALWAAAMMLVPPALAATEAGPASPEDTAAAAGSAPGAEAEAQRYEQLADLLEDEQARQRLVEELRRLADAEQSPAAAPAAGAGPGLAERVAAATQATFERGVDQAVAAFEAVAAVAAGPGPDWGRVGLATLEVAILVAVVVAVFVALRRLARLLYARAGAWVQRGEGGAALLRRVFAALVSAAVDGVTILLAWLAGWALALAVLGEPGNVAPRLSLFLSAFAAIEGIKALFRVIFAVRDEGLRLVPLSAGDAAYWYAWLAHLASFVGYGALFVVPVAAREIAPAVGQLVYLVVLAIGFAYALAIILQNRQRVRAKLERAAGEAQLSGVRVLAAVGARLWHWLAILYLVGLTAVLLVRPDQALPYMGAATLQSLVAIGLGVLIAAVIGRAISHGIRVPPATAAKFRDLEPRLNAFVPRGLQAIRLVLLVLVAALVLDAWQVFDLRAWLVSADGRRVLAALASVAVILVLATVAWIVLASWIDYWLSVEEEEERAASARRKTLLSLFRNALAVVIITMTAMIVLSELGINIGPLLAGAGVLGLAVGFGAQKLVQDIIGGVFIQLENAINTGDWVTAGGISGTAERLSIRSVGLRDLEGTFHIVPFSSVDTVSNYNRDFAYHVGVYTSAYREDTDQVVKCLLDAFEDLRADPREAPDVIGDLEISGVTQLGDSGVNTRIRIMTTPGTQWRVGRAYNRLVKKHFEAAGIEIPFPHTTLYFGQDRDGAAPPARVRLERAGEDEDPAPGSRWSGGRGTD